MSWLNWVAIVTSTISLILSGRREWLRWRLRKAHEKAIEEMCQDWLENLEFVKLPPAGGLVDKRHLKQREKAN